MDTNRTLSAVYTSSGGGAVVGHWRFDDGTGATAQDASGNGLAATLFNGAAWTTGRVGGAVSLDGLDDYVQVPDADALEFADRTFTVSLWVKTSKTGPQTLLHKPAASRTAEFLLALNRDNAVPGGLSVWTGGSWIDSSFRGVTNGQWHHLAVTFDRAKYRLYRDGVLDRVQSANVTYQDSSLPLLLGRLANTNWWFQGALDDLRRYNRVLSDSEVAALATGTATLAALGSRSAPLAGKALSASGEGDSGVQTRISRIQVDSAGQVRLQLTGPAGRSCRILASPTLVEWDELDTVTLGPDGRLEFTDAEGRSFRARFYRVVEPLRVNDPDVRASQE